MKHLLAVLAVGLGGGLFSACVTLDKDDAAEKGAPAITADMPIDEGIAAAIAHGGDTLDQVKKLFTKRRNWVAVTAKVHGLILDNSDDYPAPQLMQVINLYMSSPLPASPAVFRHLADSERLLSRQMGWQLVAAKPDRKLAAAAENKLSEAIVDDELDQVLIPEMAEAVLANDLKESYSLVRQGLMRNGGQEYARAMIFLDPREASGDLMDYLALAPVEELRQLTQKSVDVYTVMLALKHFTNFPVSTAHPHFNHLFLYSVSRNTGLAQLAQEVVEAYLPEHKEDVAFHLSRLPSWIQVAFLEGARRRMNAKMRILAGELRKVASQDAVLDELRTFR